MKTSKKIIFGFILIALINIGPAFVRMQATHKTQEHLNVLINSNLFEQEGISQVAYYLQRAKSNIRELLLEIKSDAPSQSELGNARQVIIESIAGLQENMTILKEATLKGQELGAFTDHQNSNVEISKVEAIGNDLHQFILGAQEFTKREMSRNDDKFLLGVFVNVVEPLSRRLQEHIDEFKLEEIEETNSEINSIAQHISDTKKYVIFSSVISFLVTLIFGYFLAMNIIKTENKGANC